MLFQRTQSVHLQTLIVRDFRLLPLCKRDLGSSEMLRRIELWFITDVSGQPLSPILKSQAKKRLDPQRWDREIISKRRSKVTIPRCVKSQKRKISSTFQIIPYNKDFSVHSDSRVGRTSALYVSTLPEHGIFVSQEDYSCQEFRTRGDSSAK